MISCRIIKKNPTKQKPPENFYFLHITQPHYGLGNVFKWARLIHVCIRCPKAEGFGWLCTVPHPKHWKSPQSGCSPGRGWPLVSQPYRHLALHCLPRSTWRLHPLLIGCFLSTEGRHKARFIFNFSLFALFCAASSFSYFAASPSLVMLSNYIAFISAFLDCTAKPINFNQHFCTLS